MWSEFLGEKGAWLCLLAHDVTLKKNNDLVANEINIVLKFCDASKKLQHVI
jgi:hypothetical protein